MAELQSFHRAKVNSLEPFDYNCYLQNNLPWNHVAVTVLQVFLRKNEAPNEQEMGFKMVCHQADGVAVV